MNSIDKLTEIFTRFPGIGPKQAKRFVYYLLSRDKVAISMLVDTIKDLHSDVGQCCACFRHFDQKDFEEKNKLCSICIDGTRDKNILMIVSQDIDLEVVEKGGSYLGKYFVLGGVVPILEKDPESRVRIKELKERVRKDTELDEIIIAMNTNADGDNTVFFLKGLLSTFSPVVSVLGRGLSKGAELEYVDPETFRNALDHRTK